ncbi:MAG TPA: arylsulfotransferase family protein [Solirubrobacteraceae bacterium]|nr:arylsulfotransferase family protein [Solirubrobacteraceae bacterium]
MFGTDRRRRDGVALRAGSARRRIRATVLGASAAGALAVAAPAVAGAVTVSPLPGTPDAMPATQISILGTPASNIESVTVTGSVTGAHGGHLESYGSSQGASYVLDAAFEEGEEVEATVALKEGGTIDDHFTIAHLAPPEKLLDPEGEKPESLEHFRTEPELLPPKVQVNLADPSLEGDFFLDPLPAPTIHVGAKELEFEPVGPEGLMLLNSEGKLQWWHQFPKGTVGSNLEKVSYEGKPAIAWWEGVVTETAFGEGEGIIANGAYEPIAHVKAGNGQQADIHELYITPGGQAWIDTVEPVCRPTCDESHIPVLDATVQEIDIHTGLVMWEWNAMGHVAESETEVVPANGVFDPYHLNSIQPLAGDRVLISMRDTSGVYLLNLDTGAIVWQIAGKKSSFTRGKGTRFYFQHDALLEGQNLNRLTLFADEAGPPAYGFSRGVILKLNGSKVTLLHQYLRPTVTVAGSEGSTQVLKHGRVVVGYGSTPYFSEFARGGGTEKRGTMLFDAQLPKGDSTYRVLRFGWEGTPATTPKLLAERESLSEVALYASWNGATQVASWKVLAGESAETLAPAGTYAWSGLETKMTVSSTDSVFEVQALDKSGHVLASSGPVTAP